MAIAIFDAHAQLINFVRMDGASVGSAKVAQWKGLSAATYRKVEFVQFRNIEGLTGLDFARSGEQVAKLDSFIDELTKQIRLASRTA